MFNLIKLLADINVLKVFLKSSSYQYEENCYGRFRHALTDHHFNPSPPSYQLAIKGLSTNNFNQHEKKQHAMPDTCCAVGCQNRIEILSKLS